MIDKVAIVDKQLDKYVITTQNGTIIEFTREFFEHMQKEIGKSTTGTLKLGSCGPCGNKQVSNPPRQNI